jgi:Bacterial regulatory proteins, luxR family
MALQQLLLLSAIMSMVLFAVVTIPADVRHALNSHQPLSWLVSVVVYAALVAHRRFPLAIARQLTLSPVTVKTHANHAMTKLGARDRAQLVVFAYQTGLARAPRPGPQSAVRRALDPREIFNPGKG